MRQYTHTMHQPPYFVEHSGHGYWWIKSKGQLYRAVIRANGTLDMATATPVYDYPSDEVPGAVVHEAMPDE